MYTISLFFSEDKCHCTEGVLEECVSLFCVVCLCMSVFVVVRDAADRNKPVGQATP